MILTLQEENLDVATLEHQESMRDFKPTCHLVSYKSLGLKYVFAGFLLWLWQKRSFSKIKLDLLILIFFF